MTRMRNRENTRRNLLNNLKKFVAAGVAVAAISGIAGIKPAAATPATLGFYPSTDIYGDKAFHLDVDRYSVNDFSGVGAGDTAGITYGIGDREGLFGRTDIGFDYFSNSGTSFGKSLFFNTKTQLYNDADKGVRVVGGLWLAGDTKNPLVSNTGYLLASKAFDFGRIHAGVAHAFSDGNIGGSAADDTFLHLAYDKAITKDGKFVFVADYYSGRSTISGVQPTLYYNFNDKADFGIGYFFNQGPRGAGNTDQLYLCFDYNFGGVKPPEGNPSTGDPGTPGT